MPSSESRRRVIAFFAALQAVSASSEFARFPTAKPATYFVL